MKGEKFIEKISEMADQESQKIENENNETAEK